MASRVKGVCDEKQRFVVDCDGGIDDAQAILMILARSDVDLVAITTVYGNASVGQVGRNVRRLLRVADRTDIPVYAGSHAPLVGLPHTNYFYHGSDGFGDVPDTDDKQSDEDSTSDTADTEGAVSALLRLVTAHPGEITLVCLGPLTNIALTLKLDPNFGRKLHKCVIMGGNYKGRGNVVISSEFNFQFDPESAFIILNELSCPTVLVCWELVLKHGLEISEYEKLRGDAAGGRKADFMKRIESLVVAKKRQAHGKYLPCDEIAAAVALDASIVKRSATVYATVELAGVCTRGQMVVDWTQTLGKQPNVTVVIEIHKDPYMNLLKMATSN